MSDFAKLKNQFKDKLTKARNSKEVDIIRTEIFGKNGLINSIGWKRKPKKFNHLFAPLISTPIKGTSINIAKKIKKIGNRLLFTKSVLSADIKIIIEKEILAYKRCFWKKK